MVLFGRRGHILVRIYSESGLIAEESGALSSYVTVQCGRTET